MASWTPLSTTRLICSQMIWTSDRLIPDSPGRAKLSPLSFNKTRLYFGGVADAIGPSLWGWESFAQKTGSDPLPMCIVFELISVGRGLTPFFVQSRFGIQLPRI